MFKKLKDKLTEEVKSSPQRIQQFAQAAQAAVNSASSSISDITNNDLFSIGENDNKTNRAINPHLEGPSTSSQAPLVKTNVDAMDSLDQDNVRQRRLSNSSFTSDVSFKLPSYESPAMYHLQSDIDASASEAEEWGLSNSNLDHVTKERLYSAYRRTQEKYGKYRSRYSDLARHYKLLERENAKARSVLVETQDKALRRISELREQCSLEQSAKAHLESALRVELDEKNMKIDSLTTKINLLQENEVPNENNQVKDNKSEVMDNSPQLIDLGSEDIKNDNTSHNEINVLNNKIEKMEQLLNKYKDSVKNLKERNSQVTTELQVLNKSFESKMKENDELKSAANKLIQSQQEMQELKERNEDLQNTINAYEFNKVKEIASLQSDLKQAKEEITQLNNRIDIFNKREEEYAISLAENKLSIHKELESKEKEIKSLESKLTSKTQESQSNYIMIQDFKKNLATLEIEKASLAAEISELNTIKNKFLTTENEVKELKIKCELLEANNSKNNEDLKCMELQTKQETAEKMAIIDRNHYLENRNKQITDENTEKTSVIAKLEKQLENNKQQTELQSSNIESDALMEQNKKLLHEVLIWKDKYNALESEIQDERIELVKLQTEIEKLLRNHELIQTENCELHDIVTELKNDNSKLRALKPANKQFLNNLKQFKVELIQLKHDYSNLSQETLTLCNDITRQSTEKIKTEFGKVIQTNKQDNNEEVIQLQNNVITLKTEYTNLEKNLSEIKDKYENVLKENTRLNTDYSNVETILLETKVQFERISEDNNTLKGDKSSLETILYECREKYEKLLEEHTKLSTDYTKLEKSLSKHKEKFEKMQEQNKKLNTEYNNMENVLLSTKENYEKVLELNKNLEENQLSIATINESNKSQITELEERLKMVTDDNQTITKKLNALHVDYEIIKSKHCDLDDASNTLRIENDLLTKKCDQLASEKDALYEVVSTNELKCQEYENSMKTLKEDLKQRESLQKQLNEMSQNITTTEYKYSELLKLHDSLKNDHSILFEKCEQLKIDKETLHEKVLTTEQKCMEYETSLDRLRKESDENESLKKLLQKSTKDLEAVSNNLNDIQKSYNILKDESILLFEKCEQLKQEKEDLYEKLLKSDKQCLENENKIRSLNDNIPNNDISQLEVELLQQVKDKYIELEKVNNDIQGHETNEIVIEPNCEDRHIENNLAMRETENDTLIAEKSRLLSEIEGLQTHLRKVCNDNSLLNDQLREVMANSDSNFKTQNSDELTKIQNDLQDEKQKVNDLLRENTLLAEKNLELEDCINSHYKMNTPSRDSEHLKLQEKYDGLMQIKINLERKVLELEQLERSGGCNVQQMQEKNEKLRLTNEKLERRLDEALVSLRHFQALEESTELEYLRNILYEYLTGPGLHSETLAKVIAAVVKFDPSQTKLIMQKEKERQGLLRQLGLL